MEGINIKKIVQSSIGFFLFSVSFFATAELQLIKLNVNTLSTQKIQLQFKFNENVGSYRTKLNYNPTNLMIDVNNASSVLHVTSIKLDKGGIKNVDVIKNTRGLSLQINLAKLAPYQVFKKGKEIIVNLGDVAEKRVLSNAESAIAAAILQNTGSQNGQAVVVNNQSSHRNVASVEAMRGFVNNINNIDFKKGLEEQGILLIHLDNTNIAVDIRRRGRQLIAEFERTRIPNELLSIMDVIDFSTIVKKVETFSENRKVRIVIDLKNEFNYRSEQLGTLLIIEIDKKEEVNKEKNGSQSKAISLNFQDIPVRTVLQLIADFNGMNLVITDSVSGNITLRLDDVPWKQALDIILKVRGLDKRITGNVLMIAPASELAAKDRHQLESNQQVAQLAPLYSEFIQINYAKAADMATMLSGDNARLLSERGNVSVDTRTNTLLVKDTAIVIDAIKEMIEVLDIPVKQVVIEARMVTVSDSVGEDLGVEWSGITDTGNRLNTLGVNLPITSPAGTLGIQIAKLANGNILDLQLTALEQESKAEIIASPRITTLNQQTAYI